MIMLYLFTFIASLIICVLYLFFKDSVLKKLLNISLVNFIFLLHVLISIYNDINEPDVIDALNIPIVMCFLLFYIITSIIMALYYIYVIIKWRF